MRVWNKCPGCGTTTSSVADYCPNCGEPWTIRCPDCGATWRFWQFHKFCPSCGAPVEKYGVARGRQRFVDTTGR